MLKFARRLIPRNRFARIGLGAVAFVLFLLVGPYLYSRAFSAMNTVSIMQLDVDDAVSSRGDSKAPGLRIIAYNIAHGRGLSDSNWDGGTAGERNRRLADIGALLKRLDADVVVLNEVDFNASWSGGVDQAVYLAEAAGYRYRATIRNLNFRVGLWSWQFGNAVLSRYPIREAQEIEMPGYARWETVMAGISIS